MRPLRLLPLALLALIPAVAFGHPGHEGHELTWDFSAGFLHPLLGLDHVLVMVGIGLWAALAGGLGRWAPVLFLATMAVGGLFGRGAGAPGWIEHGIAASVCLAGFMVAGTRHAPPAVGLALAGMFGLFHGFAHGAEMPVQAHEFTYFGGFLLTSAALLAAGMALALPLKRRAGSAPVVAGATLALAGLVAWVH